jgi:hypothetical protein
VTDVGTALGLRPGDQHYIIGGCAQLLRTVAAYSCKDKGDGLRLDVVRGLRCSEHTSDNPRHQ